MPRVKFLTPVATDDGVFQAGQVADVPGPLASAWAKGGNVEIIRGEAAETPERVHKAETSERKAKKKS